MSLEDEKITAIRRYLLDALPGREVQDGSRTHVDRTLQILHGVEIICTIQITTALLDGSRPSVLELEEAMENTMSQPGSCRRPWCTSITTL